MTDSTICPICEEPGTLITYDDEKMCELCAEEMAMEDEYYDYLFEEAEKHSGPPEGGWK